MIGIDILWTVALLYLTWRLYLNWDLLTSERIEAERLRARYHRKLQKLVEDLEREFLQ